MNKMNKSSIEDIALVVDFTRIPKIQKLLQESFNPDAAAQVAILTSRLCLICS